MNVASWVARVSGVTAMAMLVAAVNQTACAKQQEAEPRAHDDATIRQIPDSPVDPLELRADWRRVTRIEVRDAHNIVLEKRGEWRVVEPVDYPARKETLDDLLGVLAGITLVPNRREPIEERFGLGAEAIEVKAFDGNTKLTHFFVGYSVDGDTYVRSASQGHAWIARGRLRRIVERPLTFLRSARIVKFSYEDIVKVRYDREGQHVVLVHRDPDSWDLEGASPAIRHFSHATAQLRVKALADLYAKDFVDPPYDRDATGVYSDTAPRVTVTLRDGTTETLWLGSMGKGRLHHLRTSSSAQIYLIPYFTGLGLVPKPENFEWDPRQEKAALHAPRGRGHEGANARTGKVGAAHALDHDHQHPPVHAPSMPTVVTPEYLNELRSLAHSQTSSESR